MRDAGEPPLLEINIASKRYRGAGRVDLDVIKDLRFSLAQGSVTCLLGPSGCGKTTALRIILGLDRKFEGAVTPPVDSLKLGVVFQDPRLLPWRTVEENIRLAAPSMSPSGLEDILQSLGLSDWRAHRPGELSVGMARRAAVARALSVEPDLLVLDEAFVSLDERGASVLRQYVFGVARARGTAILMVTHNIDEALRHSDRILVLAPRPTHVLESFELAAPLVARDATWMETQRRRFEQVVGATGLPQPPRAIASNHATDPFW
ncbi:MAG: ATP-binding cassette domain-containing protein [Beijerinckiaceae bacterium]|nr:ATP-binding cassette domain-containing protein [Beijerinckiaceae bacterium]